MTKRRKLPSANHADGEFLWLISLSDLMILLFILFVVMFSAAYKKLTKSDIENFVAKLRKEELPKSPLEEVTKKVQELVKEKQLANEVAVGQIDDAVIIAIKDRVLFPSGEYRLNGDGVGLLIQLARIIEGVPEPYRVGIEGHTDDAPIHTRAIADNWDLAGKRSHSVLNALKLSPTLMRRVVLMSYADQQPLAPNRDPAGRPMPENRSRNRRVTLRIF